jgi:hypothetical protein
MAGQMFMPNPHDGNPKIPPGGSEIINILGSEHDDSPPTLSEIGHGHPKKLVR